MGHAKKAGALYTRRDAVAYVSALLGGTALVGHRVLASDAPPASTDAGRFSKSHLQLLDEMAETLLPETDTPGAKAAGVGPFVAMMVADVYTPAEQRTFMDGLDDLESRCRERTGGPFLSASAPQRLELLTALDAEQFAATAERQEDDPTHYFRMFKELALLGFYTSEIGYTQVMRYAETPGRYEPCAPYAAGEPAWARHG